MNTPARDERGRLLPGHTANPNGRPPRAKEEEMLAAIKDTFSAEELRAVLREALEIARSTQSARGLLAVAEFVADRTLGRPQVKVQTTSTRFEELLAALGSNEPPTDDTTGNK